MFIKMCSFFSALLLNKVQEFHLPLSPYFMMFFSDGRSRKKDAFWWPYDICNFILLHVAVQFSLTEEIVFSPLHIFAIFIKVQVDYC